MDPELSVFFQSNMTAQPVHYMVLSRQNTIPLQMMTPPTSIVATAALKRWREPENSGSVYYVVFEAVGHYAYSPEGM